MTNDVTIVLTSQSKSMFLSLKDISFPLIDKITGDYWSNAMYFQVPISCLLAQMPQKLLKQTSDISKVGSNL